MACIVVIYDGSDAEELKTFDRICSEVDPERGHGAFRKLSPTAYWLYSVNVSEAKVAKLGRAITKGKWYCARLEDDEFIANGAVGRWSW
jgi:hypothetical protein